MSRLKTVTATTGPSLRVGTLNRFRERNRGTTPATYLSSADAAITGTASLETIAGIGDIHVFELIMDARSPLPLTRTIALVGLMGAGKSAIGKRLAQRLGLPFVDADDEIERAAGCSIAEIFEKYGEADFRAGERRVISRLLDEPLLDEQLKRWRFGGVLHEPDGVEVLEYTVLLRKGGSPDDLLDALRSSAAADVLGAKLN